MESLHNYVIKDEFCHDGVLCLLFDLLSCPDGSSWRVLEKENIHSLYPGRFNLLKEFSVDCLLTVLTWTLWYRNSDRVLQSHYGRK